MSSNITDITKKDIFHNYKDKYNQILSCFENYWSLEEIEDIEEKQNCEVTEITNNYYYKLIKNGSIKKEVTRIKNKNYDTFLYNNKIIINKSNLIDFFNYCHINSRGKHLNKKQTNENISKRNFEIPIDIRYTLFRKCSCCKKRDREDEDEDEELNEKTIKVNKINENGEKKEDEINSQYEGKKVINNGYSVKKEVNNSYGVKEEYIDKQPIEEEEEREIYNEYGIKKDENNLDFFGEYSEEHFRDCRSVNSYKSYINNYQIDQNFDYTPSSTITVDKFDKYNTIIKQIKSNSEHILIIKTTPQIKNKDFILNFISQKYSNNNTIST